LRRNRGYEEFLQKQREQQKNEEIDADEAMRQMFGQTTDDKLTINNNDKKYTTFNVENIPVPIGEGVIKKGFITFGVLLIIQAAFLLNGGKILDFIGGSLLAGLSFLLAWKVHYKYTDVTNFYFSNFTVTLKGLLLHYRATSIFMEQSEKILLYSVGMMAVQHFFLSWLPPTSVLYAIGYYGFLLGIILNLAKRKTELIYKGLFLYSLFQVLLTIGNAFGKFQYMNYFTVLSLFLFWYLAGFFKSLYITNVDIDKEKENKNQEEQ
jgi:hypothetical protein